MATEFIQDLAPEQRKLVHAVGEGHIEPNEPPLGHEYESQAALAPGTSAHRDAMLWERR